MSACVGVSSLCLCSCEFSGHGSDCIVFSSTKLEYIVCMCVCTHTHTHTHHDMPAQVLMSVQYLYVTFHSSVEMYWAFTFHSSVDMYWAFSICSFISSLKYLFSPLWLHEGSLVVLNLDSFQ